jgi:hypothetical protein
MPWRCSILVLSIWSPIGLQWMAICFSKFGNFSAIILLNIFPMPLAYTSSPSSMPMILRFGPLIEMQSSYIFHSYFFILFSICSFYYSILCVLYSSPNILLATWFSQLDRFYFYYLTWGVFYFQCFSLIFSGFLYLC